MVNSASFEIEGGGKFVKAVHTKGEAMSVDSPQGMPGQPVKKGMGVWGQELGPLVLPPDAAGNSCLFTHAFAVSHQPGLWPSVFCCRSRAIRS